MPVDGPTPPDQGMSAEAVSLERKEDRVSSRSAVYRNGAHVGDLAWTLTDDKVLRIVHSYTDFVRRRVWHEG